MNIGEVFGRHDKAVIDSYTELYLTEQVHNVMFEKM